MIALPDPIPVTDNVPRTVSIYDIDLVWIGRPRLGTKERQNENETPSYKAVHHLFVTNLLSNAICQTLKFTANAGRMWISSPKPGSYLSRLGRMLADLRIDGHSADRNIDVNFSDNRTFEK
jgi:hypothetical protein